MGRQTLSRHVIPHDSSPWLNGEGTQPTMKTVSILVILLGITLLGCDSSTPQATPDVKKQMLGRKPTAEELAKAMGESSARIDKAKAQAQAQGK